MKLFNLMGSDRRIYSSVTPGKFGGHLQTRVYGEMNCPSALRALKNGGYKQHRVFFADEATAAAAGFRPCGSCMRQQYKAWKQDPVRWGTSRK